MILYKTDVKRNFKLSNHYVFIPKIAIKIIVINFSKFQDCFSITSDSPDWKILPDESGHVCSKTMPNYTNFILRNASLILKKKCILLKIRNLQIYVKIYYILI